ncbi:hypothetical protein FSPOR_5238 [Fusarium sporotrichioides]|uniref:Uncharacterized protein n=1 Tax=Fusarium sporotrichioides TaxID=5514 RepID=A0A395S931_FUSSP|nr:hypothetical protein FSPOR_5238 [Fusarium sporotrichioides]
MSARPSSHHFGSNSSTSSSRSSSSSSSSDSGYRHSMDAIALPIASVEVVRCMRCARSVEATSTDDVSTMGMVRIAHNLYYCERCAKMKTSSKTNSTQKFNFDTGFQLLIFFFLGGGKQIINQHSKQHCDKSSLGLEDRMHEYTASTLPSQRHPAPSVMEIEQPSRQLNAREQSPFIAANAECTRPQPAPGR